MAPEALAWSQLFFFLWYSSHLFFFIMSLSCLSFYSLSSNLPLTHSVSSPIMSGHAPYYKCVVVLGPIHFQQQFFEIPYCTFSKSKCDLCTDTCHYIQQNSVTHLHCPLISHQVCMWVWQRERSVLWIPPCFMFVWAGI